MLAVLYAAVCVVVQAALVLAVLCCCVCGGSGCFSAGRAVLLCVCWPMLLSAGRAVCCFVLVGPCCLVLAMLCAALRLLAHQCCLVLACCVLVGPCCLVLAMIIAVECL